MHELVKQRGEPANGVPDETPGAWLGEIATAPDADDQVEVVLPGYSADQAVGPCDYTENTTVTPTPGDPCVVVFAQGEFGEMVPVIVWWKAT